MYFIIFGLPGSGKTYFASAFAEKINATHIQSDKVREATDQKGDYSHEAKIQVYEKMIDRAKVAETSDIVLDATFSKQTYRNLIESKLNWHSIFYIKISASDETSRKRVQKNRKYSEADYDVYKKLKDEFETIQKAHIQVSSEQNVDEMVEQVLHYLRK